MVGRHSPITKRKPSSTRAMASLGNALTRKVRSTLSIVSSCDTLTTDARGRPASALPRRTLPGASANATLDVMTATTTVLIRLWLNELDCTTRTGRRKPGPEPVGGGSDAHQTSPRLMAQRRVLRSQQDWLNGRRLAVVDRVELGRYGCGIVLCHILLERLRKYLAARHATLFCQTLGSIEDGIGYRDGNFHTAIVLPEYDSHNSGFHDGKCSPASPHTYLEGEVP